MAASLTLFLVVLLVVAYWTTMLEPPPQRDEIDEEFEGRPIRGMYYRDRRAKILIWVIIWATIAADLLSLALLIRL